MLSSVAAACSSKLNFRQKRLRSARPHARLIRLPKGEWITSCMPPASSKKRSSTIVSCVGSVPKAARAEARYSMSWRAAGSAMPISSMSQCNVSPSGSAARCVATSVRKRETEAESSSLRPGASPAGPCAEAVGQHGKNLVEILALERPEGPSATDPCEQLVFAPFLRRALRNDLLSQHIERAFGNLETIELAPVDAVQQGRALHELVAREWEQSSLRRAADRMAGAPDPLQQTRDRARRAELADEVDLADVDAE